MLDMTGLHDRGYVYIDGDYIGTVSREQNIYKLPIYSYGNKTLSIVVENQGHICFGETIKDFKVIANFYI